MVYRPVIGAIFYAPIGSPPPGDPVLNYLSNPSFLNEGGDEGEGSGTEGNNDGNSNTNGSNFDPGEDGGGDDQEGDTEFTDDEKRRLKTLRDILTEAKAEIESLKDRIYKLERSGMTSLGFVGKKKAELEEELRSQEELADAARDAMKLIDPTYDKVVYAPAPDRIIMPEATLEDVGKVWKGYGNFFANAAEGIGTLLTTDPRDTLGALGTALASPKQTFNAIMDDLKEKSQTLEGQGEIAGGIIATIFGPGLLEHIRKTQAASAIAAKGAKLTESAVDASKKLPKKKLPGKDLLPQLPSVLDDALCFAPNTEVRTPDGTKSIKDLGAGDAVLAFDFHKGGWISASVINQHTNLYSGVMVEFTVGESPVLATAFHPVWVTSGVNLKGRPIPKELQPQEDEGLSVSGRWVNSHDLLVGDVVVCCDGTQRTVDSLVFSEVVDSPVYNLTVEGTHTFAVGASSVLVHNVAWCDYLRPHIGGPSEDRAIACRGRYFGVIFA